MIGALIAKSKVTSSYDLLNNRDIKTFLATWRDDATWIYPGDISVSGEYASRLSLIVLFDPDKYLSAPFLFFL